MQCIVNAGLRVDPILMAMLCLGTAGGARDQPITEGIQAAPPFVMAGEGGGWSGIRIDLWREPANHLGWETRFEERDAAGLLAGVGDGSLDVAIAALAMSEDLQTRIDSSHSYYQTGFSILTRQANRTSFVTGLRQEVSVDWLIIVGSLAILLLAAGPAMWRFSGRSIGIHSEAIRWRGSRPG